MVPIIEPLGPAADERRVATFETMLGASLPAEYRAFLLRTNGGQPDPPCFPVDGWENNPLGDVQLFLGLDAPIESCDLRWAVEVLADRLPAGLLPIAWSNCGDAVCLSLNEADRGSVYVWVHDVEGEVAPWRPSRYTHVHFAAASFAEFLASFESLPGLGPD